MRTNAPSICFHLLRVSVAESTVNAENIMEPIDQLVEQYDLKHGNLCPGSLLGLRMAVLGCALAGIEDPRGADRDKLVAWIEIDRWLADAVEAVTGARLGKRTLKFLDYGKLAATFLNVETGEAVRIVALDSSREAANCAFPEIENKYERQLRAYKVLPDKDLFKIERVRVSLPAQDQPGRPVSR